MASKRRRKRRTRKRRKRKRRRKRRKRRTSPFQMLRRNLATSHPKLN